MNCDFKTTTYKQTLGKIKPGMQVLPKNVVMTTLIIQDESISLGETLSCEAES